MTNPFSEIQAKAERQFPDIVSGWTVYAAGIELIELEESAGEIASIAQTLEHEEGYFTEAAIEEAVTKASVTTWAPPGYVFVRMTNGGERHMTLMVKTRED